MKRVVTVAVILGFLLSLLLTGLSTIGPTAFAADKTGTVSKVISNNVVEVSGIGKVKLIGIDSFKQDHPFHAKAATYLSTLVQGKTVKVETCSKNPNDPRGVRGVLYVGSMNVNQKLLSDGYGDLVVEKCHLDLDSWAKYVDSARAKKVGLWSVTTYPFVGNAKTKIFHKTLCHMFLKESNKVYFKSREDAMKQGFSGCKMCAP
ncbi:MAG: thermonuclease family protein [Armatimonadetes bacterium]|nr:thermonuclease family protein [Armatimonadota bacterium]